MAKKKRTRQSNREYHERIRRQKYQERQSAEDMHFRILPEFGNSREKPSAGPQKKTAGHQSVQNTKKQKKRVPAAGQAQRKKKEPAAAVRRTHTYEETPRRERRTSPQDMPRRKEETHTSSQNVSGKRKNRVYFDYTLVFIVLFLVLFGLLMLYTASIYTDNFFRRQCIFGALGVVAMVVFSKIDYHLYVKKPVLILIIAGSIISVLLVKTPLGVNLNGATRWIKIGPAQFQPAEIFKIGVILVNAFLINKLSRIIDRIQVIAVFALMAILEMLLILKVTDNLSSGLIIGLITVLMVFVAYPGYKWFIVGGIGMAGVATAYIQYVLHYADPNDNFRYVRIFAWLAPEKLADQSKVYQTSQALYSIGSGGLWGKGLGAGIQKMILPEAMNDMIFAIICEELGMIGACLVLVMFAILLYRLMFIAKNSKDLLGGMIVTGIFAHLMLQVILNVGVVTNLLPSTGVILPFISYGGTALILLMAEVGIALNVSRQIDFETPKLVRRKRQKNM